MAYVVTECHEDARSASARQRLEILHGDGPAVTVAEIPTYGRLPALGLCPLFGALLNGSNSVFALAFQRLGMSADGRGVVFEVTFEFSEFVALGLANPLTPEQEGIFFVGTDGRGLRRLGPPSREPAQRLYGNPSESMPAVPSYAAVSFAFSPNGRNISFTDRGPGPAGEDAGSKKARLMGTPGALNGTTELLLIGPVMRGTALILGSSCDPQGHNPDGSQIFAMRPDGSGLRQLTRLRGVLAAADGSVDVELPGPIAFPTTF